MIWSAWSVRPTWPETFLKTRWATWSRRSPADLGDHTTAARAAVCPDRLVRTVVGSVGQHARETAPEGQWSASAVAVPALGGVDSEVRQRRGSELPCRASADARGTRSVHARQDPGAYGGEATA